MAVVDQGAILRSGAALIPDLQAQLAQQQQLDMQRQQLGLQAAKYQSEQAQIGRELAEDQAYAADVQALSALPMEQQPQAVAALMRKYPKRAEALKKSWDSQDEAAKDANFRSASEMWFLLKNGATDKAAAILRKRVEADRAAGQDVSDDEEVLADLESGDPERVKAAFQNFSYLMQAAAGPDKFASIAGAQDDRNPLERDLDVLEKRYGKVAADRFAESQYDPIITVPLPGGRTYVGPRSGLGGISQPQEGGEPSGGGSGTDRGTRNNNPGNLKDGPFARRQPGYQGSDSGGFAVFASPSHGQKAQERLLSGNYLAKGHDTPRKIISRYAPAGENSSASMANYAAYVARRLGIGVDDKIPAGKAGLLAQAMREFETGNTKAAPAAKGPVKVTSIAQAKSLPSGTEFIDPFGVKRRVP